MTDTTFTATLTRFDPVPSRGIYKITLEIPEEMADEALRRVGGFPRSGESRWVVVAAMPQE